MTGRYQRAVDLLELITLLQEGPSGYSIQQIADHFSVSRRTAERMLSALQRRFPELQHELRKGRKYWRFVPTGQGIGSSEQLLSDTSPGEGDARPLKRTRWLTQSAQRHDAFAGTMAEALRVPVKEIGLVAKSALDQPGDARAALERIAALAARMNRTLERTLDLIGNEDLKVEPTSVHYLVESALEKVRPEAKTRGVEIAVEVATDLPKVHVDRGVISAAIVDLVKNAIDAMPEGGRVQISADVTSAGNSVCVVVEDSGPGVPAGDEEWIFEPFYSTRSEGTGLGLSMVRRAAAEHGGSVQAIAQGGRGASFRLEIPTKSAA